ncbi:MAG: cupredoxin domain-containing protein [Rudaea sp.]
MFHRSAGIWRGALRLDRVQPMKPIAGTIGEDCKPEPGAKRPPETAQEDARAKPRGPIGGSLRRRTALLREAFAFVAAVATVMRARATELPPFLVALESQRIVPAHLQVPANTRIEIVLRNTSGGAAEFEGREVRVEKVLGPGAESFVVLPPLEPGTYRFFDEFHPKAPDLRVIAK